MVYAISRRCIPFESDCVLVARAAWLRSSNFSNGMSRTNVARDLEEYRKQSKSTETDEEPNSLLWF
jgi:hypothetical protein